MLLEECSWYTFCFCEENSYRLVEFMKTKGWDTAKIYVVFVSNERKQIVLWKQRAASAEYVVWVMLLDQDYHVFVLTKLDQGLIWDQDTTLPFPCQFDLYSKEALRPELTLPSEFNRKFRLIPAQLFLEHFGSDRSHMEGSGKAFPTLPKIGNEMNLHEYISMLPGDPKYGTVIDETDFLKFGA
jgi:hypothetical protein